MAKGNIFLDDVDVPDIVKEKADMAFSEIKTKGEHKMRKGYIKVISGIAACAALAVGLSIAAGLSGNPGTEISISENIEGNIAAIERMFTLQVMAAELEEGKPVPLLMHDVGTAWGLGGTENGEINYYINTDFTCEGEDIDYITYSINNGAFQIVQPEDESIIIDGQLYGEDLNTGFVGGDFDEENDGLPSRSYEIVLYKSFTVDYDRQSDEYTWINICNVRQDDGTNMDLIWREGRTVEEFNEGLSWLLGDTVITCTVTYTDGTSQSADILVGCQLMYDADFGEEDSVITFERQS